MENETDIKINCTDLTLHQGEIAALTRGLTGVICFLMCSIALVFQGTYICHSRNTNTLQRLILYLTVSTVLYTGVLSLHLEHYFRYEGQEKFCVAIGALSLYTSSVQLLLILWITLLLFHRLFSLSETYNYLAMKCKPKSNCCSIQLKQGCCCEILFCIFCFLLPWTLIWIPLLDGPGSYGAAGPWCWIQSVDPVTCDEIT